MVVLVKFILNALHSLIYSSIFHTLLFYYLDSWLCSLKRKTNTDISSCALLDLFCY